MDNGFQGALPGRGQLLNRELIEVTRSPAEVSRKSRAIACVGNDRINLNQMLQRHFIVCASAKAIRSSGRQPVDALLRGKSSKIIDSDLRRGKSSQGLFALGNQIAQISIIEAVCRNSPQLVFDLLECPPDSG